MLDLATRAAVAALCLTSPLLAGDAFLEAKLVSPDPGTTENAGTGLALEGDRIAMGVPHDEIGGEFHGAVRVFERGPSGWIHVQKIQPSNVKKNDAFGTAVAMQGDLMLVGAIGEDTAAPGGGRVYAYERGPSGWQLVQEFVPNDPHAAMFFGDGLAIDGDTAVIGARFANGPTVDQTGAAYVFVRVNGTWVQQAKLVPQDAQFDDGFGAFVDISGDTIVASMHSDDTFGTISGAAYVYRRTGGVWTEAQKLLASDGAAGDLFGFDLGIDGNRIVVGAPREDTQGVLAGAAYVFEDQGSGFVETAKVLPSDGSSYAEFGRGLDVHGDLLVVGAPRLLNPAVYFFHLEGATWTQTDKIAPPDIHATIAELGDVVRTDGARVAAGAPRDFIGVYGDAGSVYVFGVPPMLTAYCQAKTSSIGCVPAVSWTGEPSMGSGQPFVVRATSIPSRQPGVFFLSTQGRAAQPFQGGTLCAQAPLVRSQILQAGGSLPAMSDCSGVLSLDLNAWIAAHPGAGITAGTRVNGQFWFRDPLDAFGTGLSDAVEMIVLP